MVPEIWEAWEVLVVLVEEVLAGDLEELVTAAALVEPAVEVAAVVVAGLLFLWLLASLLLLLALVLS